MLNMDEQSRLFLEKYLPEILTSEDIVSSLDLLYIWIDKNGFAPPRYEDYNDLGEEAQRVYDDLYHSN